MKKFTKFIICLMLCVMSICLVACDNRSDKDKNFNYPSSSGQVSGNGGLSVRKGNCLYFVNGFQNVDDMTEQNASYELGSLMIAELDENGNVITDENGIMKNDYINTMTDKLCGFEATNLFIGGDYLYFTSPCQEDESENAGSDPVWAKERVEFYRIKLDKSSKPEEVYQSTVSYSNLEFKYYYLNGTTYIMVFEKGESLDDDGHTDALIRVNTSSKESIVVKEDILDLVLADDANEIFYSFKNDDLYQLNQYKVAAKSSKEFAAREKTFDIVDVKAGKVFISYQTTMIVTSTDLYSAKISPKEAFSETVPDVMGIQAYDSYHISEDGNYFIGLKDNKIKVEKIGEDLKLNKVIDQDAEKITYIGTVGGNLIYIDNNNIIKSFSFYNYAENGTEEVKELSKVEGVNTTYFDLDENYVYFFKTVSDNDYLHRVSLTSAYDEEEMNDQMIGSYLDGDAPKIEEKEE